MTAMERYRQRRIQTFIEVQGMTPEQADEAFERQQKSLNDFQIASRAASLHAKENRLCKGNGGRGHLPCPACKSGTLHYSVAASNGHLWGKCSTEGCASWMQ